MEDAFFKEEAGFAEDEVSFGGVAGLAVFLGELGAVLGDAFGELDVLVGVGLMSGGLVPFVKKENAPCGEENDEDEGREWPHVSENQSFSENSRADLVL